MSTTPPPPPPPEEEPEPTRRIPQFGFVASSGDIARLPMPGNAELGIWFLVLVLFGIITLASDQVDAPEFVTAAAAVTFAYLISRGIAKAGRVLEH